MSSRFRVKAFVACAVVCSAASLQAMTVSKLSDDAFAPLRQANARPKIHLRVPLYGETRTPMTVEEFQVWAPGGKVVIHGERGVVMIDPPVRRYYRGTIDGESESFAFFAVDPQTESIEGMISIRDQKFSVRGRRANNPRPGPNRYDDFVSGSEPQDEIPQDDRSWYCNVDKMKPIADGVALHATGIGGLPVKADGIDPLTSQVRAITVEVQTDFELYQNAGMNTTTLTNYVTSLTGAVATIYKRDLKTDVTLSSVVTYTVSAAADPWAATDPDTGLHELANTIHAIRSTTAVVMLSGKTFRRAKRSNM
jgi:hypothetical protein